LGVRWTSRVNETARHKRPFGADRFWACESIRIAGYSAYFVELDPGVQNDIIDRTELRASKGSGQILLFSDDTLWTIQLEEA